MAKPNFVGQPRRVVAEWMYDEGAEHGYEHEIYAMLKTGVYVASWNLSTLDPFKVLAYREAQSQYLQSEAPVPLMEQALLQHGELPFCGG